MIWWLFLLVLEACNLTAMQRLVPAEHVDNYALCRKDKCYWVATGLFYSIWGVAALQCWIMPGSFPVWLRIIGAGLIVAGNALVIWARRVNACFVPILIYIPPHLQVKDGPYRLIRHPGYTGLSLVTIGTFFLLGQVWAGVPLLVYNILLCDRIIAENLLLSE